MVNTLDSSTEAHILEAAKIIFHEKGMAGARMQMIADKAGINKALLHYYFRSKEKLFKAVLIASFRELAPRINQIFEADLPLFKKIEYFTDQYISFVMENPYLPSFLIQELNNHPGFAKELLSGHIRPKPEKFLNQIQQEIKNKNIQPIDPMQLVINIISLCAFPFIASEMIKGITGMNSKQYRLFMESRKKEVAAFIINSIKK